MENYRDFIMHAGVKGMSWGVRNEDTLRKYGLLTKGPKELKKTTLKDAAYAAKGSSGGETGDDEWDDLPEDPNEEHYIIRDGVKIYKAEDGTAYAEGPNGEIIDADNPRQILTLYKEMANPGKRKERFSQLSEDPNSRDYVKIKGYNVRKAEDGTAYIIDKHGNFHNGDTPGEAIKSIKKTELIDKVREQVANSEARKYVARVKAKAKAKKLS